MPRKHHSSLKNKILSEWQSTNKLSVLLCSLISLAAGVYCAVASNGFAAYAVLCLPDSAPPVFFLPFLWILGFLLLGVAVGSVLSVSEKCFLYHKRRGLLFSLITFALALLWSPVFFGLGFFFLGVLIICSAVVLTLFSVFEFFAARMIAGITMLFFWFWLLFMLYLNLAVLFLN